MHNFPLNERRATQVLRILRERLSQPDVQKGARLPAERVLAAELGVSRRVLREALEILEAEHLIQRVPGRGTIILGSPHSADTAPATSAPAQPESADTLSGLDVKQYTGPLELMDARLALEPEIAALAAIHANSTNIDEIQRCIQLSQDTYGDAREWEKWDSSFHKAIGKATHNSILNHFLKVLIAARTQTAWGKLRRASLSVERQTLYIEQHERILASIRSRDAQSARLAMHEHLSTVRATLLEHLYPPPTRTP
ncbi:MAG TPA: FadR/GntR family transcriptional regulator [Paenalcaligenes sp.]|nr:FadR/GntR family transcriptional regulator [Paenalcaligenes sp.]